MEIKDILDKRAVRLVHSINSKKRLLQEISEQAEVVYGIEAESVLAVLLEREKLGSTGVGRNIAIPHARLDSINRVYGLFTRLEKPIEFESVDEQPVDLIFTLLAPKKEGAEHLKALALVSRTLRSENICQKLRANNDLNTLYSLLTDIMTHQAA